jgi:putative membrane protein
MVVMRNGYGYGGGHWGLGILMMLALLAFLGALVWIIVLLLGHRRSHGDPRPAPPLGRAPDSDPGPVRILDERLARGEIGEEEYRRIRALLTGKDPEGGPP